MRRLQKYGVEFTEVALVSQSVFVVKLQNPLLPDVELWYIGAFCRWEENLDIDVGNDRRAAAGVLVTDLKYNIC